MLAAIESRLEELFETIESLPPEKVEAAEKVHVQHFCRGQKQPHPQAHSHVFVEKLGMGLGMRLV